MPEALTALEIFGGFVITLGLIFFCGFAFIAIDSLLNPEDYN